MFNIRNMRVEDVETVARTLSMPSCSAVLGGWITVSNWFSRTYALELDF